MQSKQINIKVYLLMTKKWLSAGNLGLGVLTALLMLTAALYSFIRPSEIIVINDAKAASTLPKNPFELPLLAYEAIESPLLTPAFSPMTMQLPELKKYLVYYGKNGRPDAQINDSALYFAFNGNKSPTPLNPKEKLYVLFDKKQSPPQYVFSPSNAETPLWIEAEARGNDALVKVRMTGEDDTIITTPSANADFTLAQKEFVRTGTAWELGKWRVDGSLLARQKARWYGPDRFLEKHGGKEYQELIGKQRIDFGDTDEIYSIYVSQGDSLVWDDEHWKVIIPGSDSLTKPLMIVKKIDDRLMSLELWDTTGKAKVPLNLLKSHEAPIPFALQQQFKFVGARTRSQFVFEINKERMLLSPQDWLVQTENGWKKLTTPEEIDEYVDRKLSGTLFVFDGVIRKEDRQLLIGTLFNPSRTEAQQVELPVSPGAGNSIENPKTPDDLHPGADSAMPFAKSRHHPHPYNENDDDL